jgi:hypothetical protein
LTRERSYKICTIVFVTYYLCQLRPEEVQNVETRLVKVKLALKQGMKPQRGSTKV